MAMTPVSVSVRIQHPASGFTDKETTFFRFVHPNGAGLHHLQVYKLKNVMFFLLASKSP